MSTRGQSTATCTLEPGSTRRAVGAARNEELGFAASLDAWEPRPRADARERMGPTPCGTRWPDQNKGDAETQRTSTIRQDHVAATTSSTPPLEVGGSALLLLGAFDARHGSAVLRRVKGTPTLRGAERTAPPRGTTRTRTTQFP